MSLYFGAIGSVVHTVEHRPDEISNALVICINPMASLIRPCVEKQGGRTPWCEIQIPLDSKKARNIYRFADCVTSVSLMLTCPIIVRDLVYWTALKARVEGFGEDKGHIMT